MWRSLGLWLALALIGPATAIAASDASTIAVIKIMNFSCPYCLQMESQDSAIALSVERLGGKFYRAPTAMSPAEPGYRDYAYYAARAFGPEVTDLVLKSLYVAAQTHNLALATPSEVIEWLRQDLGDNAMDYGLLASTLETVGKEAWRRTATLITASKTRAVPTYLIIKDGEIHGMVSWWKGATPGAIKEHVAAELKSIESSKRVATTEN